MTGGMIAAVDAGPILLLVGAFVLLPLILVGGGVVAAILGWALWSNGVAEHPDSELVELNR